MSEEIHIQMNSDAEKKAILKEYRALLKILRSRITPSERKEIRAAYEMAAEAHKNTRRKSGEPYIHHPLAVAQIVAEEIGLGATSVVCALLHDVVEDTEISLEDIESQFNKTTAVIIDGLTKISVVFDGNMSISQQAENFRKLLLTLTADIRVILIKIADRLHNMRTMEFMKEEKQRKIASETLCIYAPLAHRLGLYNIKTELEDLSLKYTQPEVYKDIARKLSEAKRERTKYINEFIKPIELELKSRNFQFEIYGRPKSIHSIHNKIKNKGVSFEEVYDLFAIRIIMHSSQEAELS